MFGVQSLRFIWGWVLPFRVPRRKALFHAIIIWGRGWVRSLQLSQGLHQTRPIFLRVGLAAGICKRAGNCRRLFGSFGTGKTSFGVDLAGP